MSAIHPRYRKGQEAALEFLTQLATFEKKHEESEWYSRRFEAYGKATIALGKLIHESTPRKVVLVPETLAEVVPNLAPTKFEEKVWEAIRNTQARCEITLAEVLAMLTERMDREAGFVLRCERHPKNPHKKACEA